MDIQDILNMKLETIKEECDETSREENEARIKLRTDLSKARKSHVVIKNGKIFHSKWKLKDSYVLFMKGFASKGGLGGIPRY